MSVERDLVGDALPAYDVGDVLGRGGWGVVLAGRHRNLDRQVAIKHLPAAFAADPAARRRFTAEARVLASLDHPHVVPVFDYVERDDLCLLVMELLPGGTLRARAAATGFTPRAAVAVALACSAGLAAAHLRGVLHRDVKPENMLFAASGVVKVTDFGIAKVVGGPETVMTRAGDVLGTPAYIAPEQVLGRALSPATDVYGLATMLYELLAGMLPFPDEGDAMSVLFKHAYEKPTPLGEVTSEVPDRVEAAVMRALATDPAERYPSVESFGVALAEACAEAWGPGWLAAEGVPVLGAATIVTASERPSGGPGRTPQPGVGLVEVPAAVPGLSAAGVTAPARPPTATTAPAAVTAPPSPGVAAPAEPAEAAAPEVAAPEVGTGEAPTRSRRRILTYLAVALVVVVLAVLAVLLLPRLFSVYTSPAGEVVVPLVHAVPADQHRLRAGQIQILAGAGEPGT